MVTIRMAKIKNTANTKCLCGCMSSGVFIHYWWECKMGYIVTREQFVSAYKVK